MISIVIPAYNEEEYIGRCMASLAAQKTDQPYEVILVDNGSTDNTVTIARRYRRAIRLRIIHEPNKGRGIARRTGFAAAKGDLLLSTDADTEVPEHWIEAMTRRLEPSHVVGVVGDVQIDDCPEYANQTYNVIRPFLAVLFRCARGFWLLNGANSGFKRWAYEAAGGYSDAMDAQDDSEFSSRLRRLGTTKFVLDSCVTASGRRFREGILLGASNYVKAFMRRVVLGEERVRLKNVR